MSFRRAPYEFEAKAGVEYKFCSCGKTKKAPICDEGHVHGAKKPILKAFDADGIVWVCGCGKTETSPICDGAHRIFP